MTGKTHILAGALAALALHGSGAEVVMTAFGALLPDIDTAQSAFGRYTKLVSRLLPHRGPTHSLLMLALSACVNPWLGLGVLTHLLLDMMTAKGVQLLWPWSRKVRFPLAKRNYSDSRFERLLRLALLAATVVVCVRSIDGSFSLPQPPHLIEWWKR